ncbi:restriction endonuclease subunit S [Pelagicoccus sp. NFK12]|uniref:Restriction endonuclease subunit S n=1 Tax=Pelagicoccus enzymogenes TaxID=2773457 RepID=A0A927FA04_9BACT|nr:restriction endonuclease subunit S [Pelagicoccus enzymogenes]MBD5781059.1 restriction endonuclease subunit S [Pelagicoccus enzymogenes]
MAVKTGYKQTEVGKIPEDWKDAQLGPHVVIKSGDSPSLQKFDSNGIPYFKVDQLNLGEKFIKESPYRVRSSKRVPKGSIIFPKRGASILLNKVRILSEDSFFDTNLMSLTVDETIDSEYLFYALKHLELWRIADTTSIPQINNKHITPLVVPLPPTKAEQEAIAEALSDADALIESLEQLIAKKRQIKQGAMQQLLTGKKRLPGFSGEWTEQSLYGKVRLQVGFPFSSAGFSESASGFRLIRNRDLKSVEQKLYYAGEYSENFIVRKGDLLVGMDGEFLLKLWDAEDSLLNQRVGRIHNGREVDRGYLYYALRKPMEKLESTISGTTVKHLSHKDVENLEIFLPQLHEQTAIAETLSDMDEEIVALEAKLSKARQLKQGMMQELLTGKTRLVAPASNG